MEASVFGESMQANTPEASFYYATIAETCFRRIVRSHHPNAGGALRDIGRKYLAKANGEVASEQISKNFLVSTGHFGAREPERVPCKVD
jgi:hypothetical protein